MGDIRMTPTRVATRAQRPADDIDSGSWAAPRFLVALAYSLVVLIPLPWLLQKAGMLEWCAWLAGLGIALAGAWVVITHTIEKMTNARALLFACVLSSAVIVGGMLGLWIGSASSAGYNVLKSGGILTYILLGLAPVLLYALGTYGVLIGRRFWLSLACVAVGTFFALFFWASFQYDQATTPTVDPVKVQSCSEDPLQGTC